MVYKIMFLLFSVPQLVLSISRHPKLIIISYDAFGNNLFDVNLLPNMERLRKVGTYTDYMVNVFPTKTFPNHHSIATGLYPESHGVIDAKFFDIESQALKKKCAELFQYNNDVIPIWRWNEDQDGDRYSASMMWPGTDYFYQGKNITYCHKYSRNMDYFDMVDIMFSWLTDPIRPANLVMFYVEAVDYAAHHFGPGSLQFKDALKKVDSLTKYIDDQLDKYNLSKKVNMIHLSDHGIRVVPVSNIINITQYMTFGTYTAVGSSPLFYIYPREDHEVEIYDALKLASVNHGHFKVYQKKNIPERWHYKNNPRVAQILVVADEGYVLEDFSIKARRVSLLHNFTLTNSSEFGIHGYDNALKDMRPFFMARGPKIKKQHKVPPFNITDLYNLFTKLLEIPQRPNNGLMTNILDIISDC